MSERSTAKDLLREVAKLSGQQRDKFIAALPEDQRTQLERDLAGEAATVDMQISGGPGTGATTILPPNETMPVRLENEVPTTIGPYRIVQPIGQGGMGQVFIAEQHEPIKRRVALKIIKTDAPSREILARFDAERQALAMMDHQNIAKVLDAGITDDGRPYFAMELVKGVPITNFCDRHKLTPRERLDIFVQTCRAIQHAHQKGIIHRDIKPSNVLVTEYEGRPIAKVIDFGLAKALQDQIVLTDQTLFTQCGQIVGTLEYMSPEQAELNTLDIDTRTDVYSLGVILYELLTGSTPLGRERIRSQAYDQVLRLIREEDAPRMISRISTAQFSVASISEQRNIDSRQLSSLLRGDLQWIVMRALEKDRSRRYEGAGSLADDVQRHLDDEPVDARPPTMSYRLHKAYRKHKAEFITAVGIACLLVAGLVGTGTMWLQARSAANKASLAKRYAEVEAANAREAEAEATIEKSKALAAKQQVEATLARSNYLFAFARWDAGRVGEALDLLRQVPPDYRNFEWYLAQRKFNGGDFTIYGHTSTVSDVAYRHDGQQIASGSFDKTIKVWDAITGKQLKTFSGHTSNVTSVAYSPDGTRIASGSTDNTIRIWNTDSGDSLTLRGHTGPVNRVRFSPDGSLIASASWDNLVKIWDATTGQPGPTLKGHAGEVLDVTFAPGGALVASCGRDNAIRLWDPVNGEVTQTIKGHTDRVTSVAFHPRGDLLASASFDQTVRLWTLPTGAQVRTLKRHSGNVTSVTFSPDGARIVSATDDDRQPGTIRVWDAKTGALKLTLKGHQRGVTSVALNPDGSRIASAGGYGDNTIKVWDARSGDDNSTFSGHLDRVTSVAFSPDGQRIASGSNDTSVQIWDARLAKRIRILAGHRATVTDVTFSHDGSLIASGGEDRVVRLWDAESGDLLMTLDGPKASVSSVSFSHDDQLVAAGSWDHSITLWNSKTGQLHKTLKGHSSGVLTVAFSSTGNLLASAGDFRKDSINIWDVRSGQVIQSFQGHSNYVTAVSFNADASQLASVSADAAIKLWDVNSGELLHTLKRHTNRVDDVAFSPDGTRLASASYDNTIRLWDTVTGDELRTIKGHSNYVTSVSFSPNGQFLASASWDKTIKLWRATVTSEQTTLLGHTDTVTLFAFSPDSSLLASAANDNKIKLWNLADGGLIHTCKGHTAKISSIAFDAEGSRILSRGEGGAQMAWNMTTGQQIAEPGPWPDQPDEPGSRSPDGRWLALALGNQIQLIDLEFKNTPLEHAYRQSKADFDPYWHEELAASAETAERWFEALFHRAWVVKNQPTSNEAHLRMRLVDSKLRQSNPDLLADLPPSVRQALSTPAPPLNESYAEKLNVVILSRVAVAGSEPITAVSLQEMKNICETYPKGRFFHTLGIALYRAGDYQAALDSLTNSLLMMPTEFDLAGPHPGDLAFFAMCLYQLDQKDAASDFHKELSEGVRNNSFRADKLDSVARRFLAEVDELFASEKAGTGQAATGE